MEFIKIGQYFLIHELSQILRIHFHFSGTKNFVISVSDSENGPWEEIKSGTFVDPRQHGGPYNPQDLETFQIDPITAQYVKFSCTSYYGSGCVLQYIEVFKADGKVTKIYHVKCVLVNI